MEGEAHNPGRAHVGHHVPLWVLVAVLAALLVLTVLTVVATWFDLGSMNLLIAMVIATVKAALVALFFMHLAYDKPFNAIVLVGTLFFVMLFISMALLDAFHYRENIDAFRADRPDQVAPMIEVERSKKKP